jgi:short-subunit dehydrogenase
MGALDRSRWDPSTAPLDESSSFHPTSPYGRAKVAEEALVRASTVNWTIVRIPWCYGPGMAESHHVRNLLNRVGAGALASRLNWPGRVSLVEVGQAARELVRSATNPRTLRETFFLADDEPIVVGRLFSDMGQTVGQMSAGAVHLPDWFWRLARLGLPLAPFTLKCLMTDALVVSTTKAQALGVTLTTRDENFLVPLARYNATELHPSRHGSAALVTGAAGGIGACLARQLFARGYTLILADYNEEALAARCRVHPGALTWQIDLSDANLAEKLPVLFPHTFPWPALVINNAGVGWRGNSWDASAAECQRIISVNATAPALIANFFLHASPVPVVIVNTASTAAFQPLPYMAAYAAAKSFILSFSLALHAELRASHRRDFVITVVPGGTQTGFQSAAGVGTNPREKLLTPDEVAASILTAVERRRPFVYIGTRARAMSLAASLMPFPLQAFVWEKLMRKLR